MADRRPRLTDMPVEPRAITEAACETLRVLLADTFERIAALDGDPAERQNDALSAVAQLAAFAGVQVVARIMVAKGVDAATAWPPALIDIQARMQGLVLEAYAQRRARHG